LTPAENSSPHPAAGLPPSRYQPIQFHAAGNLGEVLLAQDPELNRSVALKRIQERHADNPESRRRFLREAEITGRLEHPGVVPVHGLGQDAEGRPCYAMRFIQGESLKDAIVRFHAQEKPGRDPGERRLALRQLLTSFVAVCKTMAYAHSRGVLHRDLKPANIMLGKYGETLVVDWGLARTFERDEVARSHGEASLQPGLDGGGGETQVGSMLGTPAFASPEQAAGHWDLVGPASDIFSLGATLYNLLTNASPYQGEAVQEIIAQASMGEVVPPRQRKKNIPRALEGICLKAMAKKRQDRYATALDLAADVEHWLADEPVRAHQESLLEQMGRLSRRHRAAAVAGGALLVAGLALAASLVLAHARTIAEQERSIADGERRLAQEARDKEQSAREAAEEERGRADRARQEAEQQREVADRSRREAQKQRAIAERAKQAEEGLTNVLRVDNGLKLRDQGDAFGALLWFTKALAMEKRGKEYEALQRQRAAAMLGECPRVTQVWCHQGPVVHAEFSPNGQRVVTASWDRTARVWDAVTGEPVTPPLEHQGFVQHSTFSPNGRCVVTSSADLTARVWDARTGKPLTPPLRHQGEVRRAVFGPDGRRVATASWDRTARVWDAATGQPITPPLQHDREVLGVAFSPDGRQVVTASEDKTARVWDTATGLPLTPSLQHPGKVQHAAFSPDGRWIVSACEDNVVRVWDAATGKPAADPLQHKGMEHKGPVEYAAFSQDGRFIVTAGLDQTARVWGAVTGQVHTPVLKHTGAVEYAAFSPDGRRVVTASKDKTARIWDADTGQPLTPSLKHYGYVVQASFSPDSRRILTASFDGTARVWDLPTGLRVSPPLKHHQKVVHAAFSPDGRHVVTASYDHTARVWDAATGQPVTPPLKHNGWVAHAAFSPDGRQVVTASYDQTARVWDAATGKPVTPPLKHNREVMHAAFSPDGRQVVTASYDQTARVWDAVTGQPITPPLKHNGEVEHAAFSPDSRRVVTASYDQTARVWDAVTGQPVTPPLKHTHLVMHAAFSPDGRRVVTASWDQTGQVWDVVTGKPAAPPMKHDRPVMSVALSADGRLAATTCLDGTARVWDMATGQPLTLPLRPQTEIQGWDMPIVLALTLPLKPQTEVQKSVFSPDGRRVVTTNLGKAQVWEAATGRPVTPVMRTEGILESAAFSRDGRRIVTFGVNEARVWLPFNEVAAMDLLRLAELMAGYSLDEQGGMVPMDLEAWMQCWDTVKRHDASQPSSDDVRIWHQEEGLACANAALWAGVIQHLDLVLEKESANGDLYASRGLAHAALGHWPQAIADFKKSGQLETDFRVAGWHTLCLAALGDWPEHRRVCADILQRFGNTADVEMAQNLAWYCVRFRQGPADLDPAQKLADQAVAKQPKTIDRLKTLGAALYRSGRYEDAIVRLQEGIQFELFVDAKARVYGEIEHSLPGRPASNWLFLGLAQQKLGNQEEAKKNLVKAQQWIDQRIGGLQWDQRLELQLLRAEAEEAISKRP
jgi:WD40 repeat protein/tetratricopeptide (TPR) repeat protein/tRNA A-37 threonylcarbamoyl transferase component Bud32